MKHLLLQLGGLCAVVTACFLFSSFVGRVALITAGTLLIIVGVLEELNGTRTAPPEDPSEGR